MGLLWLEVVCLLFFFKQKTAYEMRISDWSSDVCSSDLPVAQEGHETRIEAAEERSRAEVERHHHGVGAGEVGVVVQDRVASEGLPERRRSGDRKSVV